MPGTDLLRAIGELETTLDRLAQLIAGDLAGHRRSIVQLRRQIADHLVEISKIGERAFEGSDESEAFRAVFSRSRSATALHQASWPVVAIDLDDPRYHASVRPMREANREFIAWVKATLAA